MSLRVDAPDLQDVHELGTVTVHEPGSALPHQHAVEEEIAFLKEQQWTLEFATVPVVKRGVHSTIDVPATVQPRSGGEMLLIAAAAGRILPATGTPVPGTRVRGGSVLAQIAPLSDDFGDAAGLRAVVVEAEQAHALAVQNLDRTRRLVEARALPRRRLDEAQAALTVSASRLDAAGMRWQRYESQSDSCLLYTSPSPRD